MPHRSAKGGDLRPGVDALALGLLLLSLVLPWNLVQPGAGRVEVVLSVVVCAASLALPMLARRGRLGLTPATLGAARMAAALPYGVCVLVALLVDAARGLRDDAGHAGLGASMAVGLAGAVLAARPRRWRTVLAVLVAVDVTGVVVSTIVGTVDVWGFASATADARPILAGLGVLVLAFPAARGLAPEGGGEFATALAWRRVALVVGSGIAAAYVVGAHVIGPGQELTTLAPIESLHDAGFGLVLLPAAGACALLGAHPAVDGGPARDADGSTWIAVASCAASVATALGGVVALVRVNALLAGQHDLHDVVLTFLVVVGTVLALLVLSVLRESAGEPVVDPLPGAVPLAIAAVVVGVLGLLVIGGDVSVVVTQADVLASLWLPVAVMALLLGPGSVRRRIAAARRPARPLRRSPGGGAGVGGGVGGGAHVGEGAGGDPLGAASDPDPPGVSFLPGPARATPASSSARPGFTPGQAADPATSPALLAAIAELAPELRPALAANTAASPELLDRLASFGDPDVDAVLRARGLL